MEFVCHADDVVAAHHSVSGMNFIPGGYTIPATIREARAEAESQLVANGAVESEIEPPSPANENEFLDTQDDKDLPPLPTDVDLPPSRPDEVHIGSPCQDAGRPPAQDIQAELDVESPHARDPQTLKLDIRKPPPSKELIQRVSEIMRVPQSTSKGDRRKKKKVPSSVLAPMQLDHPKDDLLSLCELRSKLKQD